MPICKDCGKSFQNRVWIDGKERVLNRRKFCLDCSPFNEHNTKPWSIRQREEIKAEERICKNCSRQYVYNTKKGHTTDYCNSCNANTRRIQKVAEAINYKGGCCLICGYDKLSRALSFHHLDPSKKLFNISGNHCRRWEIIKAELDKCVLLCLNCHTEVEAGLVCLLVDKPKST